MTRIKLDASKLLGFRLVAGATTAKNGNKVRAGAKNGGKLGQKVGGKVGTKVRLGAKTGIKNP